MKAVLLARQDAADGLALADIAKPTSRDNEIFVWISRSRSLM